MEVAKDKKYMLVVRILIVLIGVACMTVFVVPLSLSVNLNIGNATGIAVSSVIILYGLFMPILHKMLRKWRQDKVKRFFVYGLEGVAIVITVLVVILTGCMVKGATNAPKGNETLIVLGCKVYGERASLSLMERLEAAYDYMETYPNTVCVVSGGQGIGENISEAECMYRYLVNKGIDGSRIYKEEQSTSTRENIEFSLQVIKGNDLPQDIAIATSEYHQYRAGLIAKQCGVDNTAVCGKTAKWLFPTHYVRELYGILYEWVF